MLKATAVFSNLSAPTIIIGTASTTISGTLATAGGLVPPGVVTITLNGVSQSATIAADGSFSSVFATGALAPVVAGYPITFTYAGSANFNPASGASTLIVTYNAVGVAVGNSSVHAGATIPFKVQLFNAQNVNLSASTTVITAYGVRSVTDPTWLPADTSGNGGSTFRFQTANGGQYQFNLKTTGLATGNYLFGYTVAGDPVIHTIPFSIN